MKNVVEEKPSVLDELCEVRLHQSDEVNNYIHYDETMDQLKSVLGQEHHYLLHLLEQDISQSLSKSIQFAYKLGFQDATKLLQGR